MRPRTAILALVGWLGCTPTTPPDAPAAPAMAAVPKASHDAPLAETALHAEPVDDVAPPPMPTSAPAVEPMPSPAVEDEPVAVAAVAEPLEPSELLQRVATDLPSLPAMSVGKPNAGALVNGVQMTDGAHWEVIDPRRAYATPETIRYLTTAIEAVEQAHGHVHPVWIGHLSDHDGGRLWPHRSHQSGRDVDLSYYYVPDKAEWYRPATKHTLDLPRTWTFVRALLTSTDVELILIDRKVQKLLKRYAAGIGEDSAWLDEVFQYRSRTPEPIIRHAHGHRTHIHVRFHNPTAERIGHHAFDALVEARRITPRHYTVTYRASGGDSVASLAAKAGTSVETFAKMNGGTKVQAGRLYTVPMRGQVARRPKPTFPERRLPPPPSGTRSHVAGEM